MRISCTNTGKRFNRDWIFRKLNYEFKAGCSYAITGPNGSGKSTLLQVIAGAVVSSEGNISYHLSNLQQEPDEIFKHISIAAPYLELIEEMTLLEFFRFHETFKPLLPGHLIENIISTVQLREAANKEIRYYSSGMKQRVKLAQAIFSNTPCLLLDEPCTNLDDAGIRLFHQLIRDYGSNRLIIVSSNDVQEYTFCKNVLNILDYK